MPNFNVKRLKRFFSLPWISLLCGYISNSSNNLSSKGSNSTDGQVNSATTAISPVVLTMFCFSNVQYKYTVHSTAHIAHQQKHMLPLPLPLLLQVSLYHGVQLVTCTITTTALLYQQQQY
jgi:hypothetical protein